jgi:hypothetical protein
VTRRRALRPFRSGATILLPLTALAAPACTPVPPPVARATGCEFFLAPERAAPLMDCAVSGPLPDAFVDPAGGRGCSLASYRLSGQSATMPLHVRWGVGGEDEVGRLRLAAIVSGATYVGSVARSAGIDCASVAGPAATVTIRFGGRHLARIDRSQTPACVFESRLDLGPSDQVLGAGLGADLSAAVRASVRDALARRLDFELASAVNHGLFPGTGLEGGFRTRSGRCPDDYREYAGE